ncbi:MAG: hypothetical protein AAGF67_12640 [Verrucomicrobiota bacterium]
MADFPSFLDEDGEMSASIDRELIESNFGFHPWWEGHGWIYNKERKLVQPVANVLQQRFAIALEFCLENNLPIRLLMLKPRQRGCSTVSMAGLYWLGRRFAMNNIIIGGEYSQTDSLWSMMKTYNARDTFAWGNQGHVRDSSAEWSTGTVVGKETARDAEAGRSHTIQGLIATEAARWKENGIANATEVITGILNCIPDLPNTVSILESTSAGDYGMFYDYWGDGADLDDVLNGHTPPDWNGYIRIFAGWHEFEESHHSLTKAQASALQRTYSDHEREMVQQFALNPGHISYYRRKTRTDCKRDVHIMMREHPSTPEEAFHAASNRRFNGSGLAILSDEAKQNFKGQVGTFEPTSDDPETRRFLFYPCPPDQQESLGVVTVWEPPKVGLRYLAAVDIASGKAQTSTDDPDHHCAIVLRQGYMDPHRGWQRPAVVASTVKPCRWPIDILADNVHALSDYYGNCIVLPESNKHEGLIPMLLDRHVNVFEQSTSTKEPASAKKVRPSGNYGVETVGGKAEQSRSWMIAQLDTAVREWDEIGGGIYIPDEETLHEMKRFVVNIKSGRAEAAEGEHDDRVIALVIGYSHLLAATPYVIESEAPELPRDIQLLEEMDSSPAGGQFS